MKYVYSRYHFIGSVTYGLVEALVCGYDKGGPHAKKS